MNQIKTITQELDGEKIAYCSETLFTVDVGRYSKGKYKTKYSFKGNLGQAVFYYRCLNVGKGYKARLTMNGKVLRRKTS